ncbi:MAG: hypothetical protein ABIJ39_05435 [Chloroflexota bacterium]
MFVICKYKRYAFFCAFLITLFLLAGCNLPSDEPCSESELSNVADPAPSGNVVVNTLTPVLTWTYPDPSCYPDHYVVKIYDRDVLRWPNDFLRYPPVPIHEGETDGPYYNVPASAGLQPGETYFWKVSAKTAEGHGSGSLTTWFTTGPLCDAGSSLLPATLIYPPNRSQAYFPDTIDLEWDNQMSCWPAGDFYLQISTTEDFRDPIWYGVTHNKDVIWISSGPPMFSDCTRYYWRVRTDPAGGGEGPYSETWSFVLSWSETFCPLDLRPTLIPREPVRIPPFAGVKSNASCRSGPSLDYPIVDYLEVGQTAPIEGRDEGSNWWYILSPNLQSQCWISHQLVDLTGDFSQAPVVEAPPLPLPALTDTPAPFDCTQYATNPNACNASNYCRWDASVPPNGACVNR